jgi:hypothetical protein
MPLPRPKPFPPCPEHFRVRRFLCGPALFYGGLLCLTFLALTSPSRADSTWVSGTVSGEWTAAGNPYIVTDSVRIPAGDSLEIGAGVHIFMMKPPRHTLRWLIEGSLNIHGTMLDSVTFSMLNDSSLWTGLYFLGLEARCSMNYAAIRQAHCAIYTDLFNRRFQLMNSSIIDHELSSGAYSLIHSITDSVIVAYCAFHIYHGWGMGGRALIEHTQFQGNDEPQVQETILVGGSGALIRSCQFEHFSGSPLIIYGEAGEMTITNCLFDLPGDWSAIGIAQNWGIARHIRIVNNSFVGSQPVAIEYLSGTDELVTISNNVFTNAWETAIEVWGDFRPSQYQITNNCFWNNNYNFQVFDTLFNWPEFGSLIQTNQNGDSTDIYGNIFIDPMFDGSEAYGLTEDSPCIDAGTDVGLPYAGVAPDMGYLEFGIEGTSRSRFILPPSSFNLSCFPNPFNPATTISFTLPKASYVDLNVYDVTGRKTGGLLSAPTGVVAAGEHSFVFDGSDLPSGIYFVRMDAGDVSQTRKIVLLK